MKNKYQRARILIIDRKLSKGRIVKTQELRRLISQAGINVSLRQIEKDLEHMQEDLPIGYAAPISYNSKRKGYYYTDPDFTIQALGLKSEDVIALLFYAKTLEQYKGFKIFENILRAVEKVIDNSGMAKETKKLIANRTLIQTEKTQISKGIEFIEPILKAILEKQKIDFDYKKFDDLNFSKRTLSPILLKEDKNYWYVIGVTEDKKSFTTYALDRMSNLIITNKYFTVSLFDADTYFKYSFGVTVSEDNPTKIVLSFTPFQGNYLKALPIHETQEIIKDNEKELRISVIVKPSYEFFSKILSYGEDVKVVSPKSIVREVKKQIRASLQRYN